MAVLDVGKLLVAVSEAEPSGPNLEYDPAFAALEKASEGKAEQVIGGVVTAAEPPDWNVVSSAALALLERTRDLRVAVSLTRALLYRGGIPTFGEGMTLIRRLLETHWASLHPQLDPDDNNDPTMRVTALSTLTTSALMLALRTAPLVESRVLGAVSLADLAPAGAAPDSTRIGGVFADAELPAIEASFAALTAAADDLRAIEAVFEANAGSRGPDLAPLVDYFHKARVAVEPRLAERRAAAQAAQSDSEAGAAAAGGAAVMMPPARGLSGDILSREDVLKALDKICLYYERNEPSSPVPLVAERCKRLVTMSFMDILTDVAPEGLKQAQLVVGKREGK